MRAFPFSWMIALLTSFLWLRDASAADITLTTSDQKQIHAWYEPAPNSTKAVILVHGENRSSADWKFLVPKLVKAGFRVLAVDLRGQGVNAKAGAPALTEADWKACERDVLAAADYLAKQGVKETSVVGANLGASLALRVGAQRAEIKNVVLLSPGLNVKGVTLDDSLKSWGNRPLLIVVSQEDSYSAKTSLLLYAEHMGRKHMQLYNGAGSGATMLNREPTLEGLLSSWLLGTFVVEDQLGGESGDIKIGGGERIETSGPRLPGH